MKIHQQQLLVFFCLSVHASITESFRNQQFPSGQRYTKTNLLTVKQQTTLDSSSSSLQLASTKNNNKDYNDDAFGFVFLGSLVLTQDPWFAGSFLTLSAMAATVTRADTRKVLPFMLPATKAVPAAVAGFSLLVAIILRQIVVGQEDLLGADVVSSASLSENAPWIQLGLCTVSMVYGFVLAERDEETV